MPRRRATEDTDAYDGDASETVWSDVSQNRRKAAYDSTIPDPGKRNSINTDKITSFRPKKKLSKFPVSKSTLEAIAKKSLQSKGNGRHMTVIWI